MNVIKSCLKLFACNTRADKRKQDKVVIRASGNEVKAFSDKSIRKSLCIINYSLLIFLELRLESLSEAYSLAGDNVHERAALCAWEYC